jgi:predicted ATP-grasp superfamily ATP-dependent carboligase
MFVAAEGRAVLLGVSQQHLASLSAAHEPFVYAGSIGPLDLTADRATQWERIGQTLAARFELRGLFGVDAIVADRQVWPVEVNPRYPASAEVWDMATGESAIKLHIDACLHGRLPSCLPGVSHVCGKQIVFAQEQICVAQACSDAWLSEALDDAAPRWADIPRPGMVIGRGEPILTTLARGTTAQAVSARLTAQSRTVIAMLEDSAARVGQ